MGGLRGLLNSKWYDINDVKEELGKFSGNSTGEKRRRLKTKQ